MQNWIVKILVEWLVNNLTAERIKEWSDQAKNFVLPWLRATKDKLIASLKAEAQKTDNSLDDSLVDALDSFLEAFLFDNPTHL